MMHGPGAFEYGVVAFLAAFSAACIVYALTAHRIDDWLRQRWERRQARRWSR